MSAPAKTLLARAAPRERGDEAHGVIVEVSQRVAGALALLGLCRLEGGVQRRFAGAHEAADEGFRAAGQYGGALEELGEEDVHDDRPRIEFQDIHVPVILAWHADSSPESARWTGWAGVNPARIAPGFAGARRETAEART